MKKLYFFINYFIFGPIAIALLLLPIYILGFGWVLKTVLPLFIIGLLSILFFVYLRRREFRKELKIMEKKYTGDLNDYILMGYTAFNAKDFNRADQIFNDIVKKYPEKPAGYCGLGLLEFDRKNFKNAKSYFEKTLELDYTYKFAEEKLRHIESKALA